MANSWNGPKLGSPIRTDVPELQKKLIALLRQDPTSVADIPAGAKRLANPIGEQWQVQRYNGSSWNAISKLMHDVDKVDGYHAAIKPAARTVAVRNAEKKLEGDITGNAATASSAATLSETLPVNKGGTGATTSEAARTNLGVPPTSHASSGTTYGLGSNANYGHVRGDGVTTNVVSGEVVAKDIAIRGDSADLASKRGQIGNRASLSGIDYNSLVKFGHYVVEGSGSTNTPTGTATTFYVDVFETKYSSITRVLQIAYRSGNAQQYVRSSLDSGETWSQWEKSIYNTDYATASTPGIVKPGTGMSVDSAGSLGVDATVVRTSGSQNIEGAKKFIDLRLYSKSLSVGTLPTSTLGSYINIYDNNGVRYSGLGGSVNSNGVVITSLFAKPNDPDSLNFEYIRLIVEADGTSYASAPTPKANSNTNHIATTEWVRNYALPTGVLIPSLATSMTGYLLCNGAAVSRTTYANLFSIIGTKFGAGDGSTTFNLPDFRNRVFWGASGNLMSILAAGLPNATGQVDILSSSGGWDSPYYDGALYAGSKYTSPYLLSGDSSNVNHSVFLDLSKFNTIYGKSTTVQPPAIAVNIFIKY